MNKYLLIVLLLFLFTFASQAQGKYSRENLEKASSEELTNYLIKAQKLKKTGTFIILPGISVLATGIGLMSTNREAAFYMGFAIGIAGIGITLVGLPVISTGSSRVKRVSKIFN